MKNLCSDVPSGPPYATDINLKRPPSFVTYTHFIGPNMNLYGRINLYNKTYLVTT